MDFKNYQEFLLLLLKNLGQPSKVILRTFSVNDILPTSYAAISFAGRTPDEIPVVIKIDDLFDIGVTREQINELFGHDIFTSPVANAPTSEALN